MRTFDVAQMISDAVAAATAKAEAILAYHKMLIDLEAAGVDVGHVDNWDVRSQYPVKIQRHELSKVRSVVGRLSMVAKDVAWDFDTSNELNVSLKPTNKDYPFLFTYRTQYRKGGKCEVVSSVCEASISKSLVCKI